MMMMMVVVVIVVGGWWCCCWCCGGGRESGLLLIFIDLGVLFYTIFHLTTWWDKIPTEAFSFFFFPFTMGVHNLWWIWKHTQKHTHTHKIIIGRKGNSRHTDQEQQHHSSRRVLLDSLLAPGWMEATLGVIVLWTQWESENPSRV